MPERLEPAGGTESPATALDHTLVAAFGQKATDNPELPAAIRGAHQDNRRRGHRRRREPPVREQDRPIRHLDFEISLYRHVPGLGPGQLGSLRQAPAQYGHDPSRPRIPRVILRQRAWYSPPREKGM